LQLRQAGLTLGGDGTGGKGDAHLMRSLQVDVDALDHGLGGGDFKAPQNAPQVTARP
jgi:hypothetical protein